MSQKIDFTTFNNYAVELPSGVTVNNVGGYNRKPIPGLSLTVNGPVGAKYFIISTASFKPTANCEVYLAIFNDSETSSLGTNLTSDGVSGDWCGLTATAVFTTTAPSHNVYATAMTSGANSISVDVLAKATLTAIRIA